ncbi:hypothetical protein [Microcoleus sp.]|uniref:hypothetical protein n=1 Tax=Microcoleus sp. TaxID=44472 RepID=UPI0035938293
MLIFSVKAVAVDLALAIYGILPKNWGTKRQTGEACRFCLNPQSRVSDRRTDRPYEFWLFSLFPGHLVAKL